MEKIPGVFVPLDAHYLRDPAIRRAGSEAELLYLRTLAHIKASSSDGFLADFDLEIVGVGLKNLSRRVAALIKFNLWEEVEGGWVVTNWFKWNKASSQVKAEKKAKRDAAILANHTRWHVDSVRFDPRCEHCELSQDRSESDPTTDRLSDPRDRDRGTETETETQLTTYPPGKRAERATAKRGSRISPDFTPSAEDVSAIRDEFPGFDSRSEHPSFVDYWIAAPGQKGVKLDWHATWRNWMRRAAKEASSRQGYRNQNQIMADVRAQAAARTEAQGSARALIEGGSA